MNIDCLDIKKGGNLVVRSIFEIENSLDITLLIDRCRRAGCTLHFNNEDLTIDEAYGNDTAMMARVTLYTLLAGYPKAARDYYNYLYDKANNETAPGE